MLYDKPRKRNGKVIPQALLAYLRSERLVKVCICEGISGVEDTEEELITFFSILSEQRGKVLLGRSLDFRIAICSEYTADCIEI